MSGTSIFRHPCGTARIAGACPSSRPAINSSALLCAALSFRTEQRRPVIVRLTDTPGPESRSGCWGARWPRCTASWSLCRHHGAPTSMPGIFGTSRCMKARNAASRTGRKRLACQSSCTGIQDGPGQRESLAGIGRALAAAGEGQWAHAGRCCMDQQLSPERLLSDFSKIPSAWARRR